jgi:polyisoprenoid-binding protein YceI
VNVASLNLVQQVKSIKSSEGSLMDKYMYEAMKADQYSTITFQMTQCSVIGSTSDGSELLVKGNLTIAGVTKAIEMKVTGHKLANNEIRFDGNKPIKMTEYGIKPPVVMGMKVGDEVTIKWDLVFAPN